MDSRRPDVAGLMMELTGCCNVFPSVLQDLQEGKWQKINHFVHPSVDAEIEPELSAVLKRYTLHR